MSTKGIFASLKRSRHISGLVLSIMLVASTAWILFTEPVSHASLLDTLQTSANSPEVLFTDLNGDGIVNIFDVVIVAAAFDSYSGHPQWDFRADLDHDGKIAILDLELVARDFGKIGEKSISLKRYTASGSFQEFSAETIARLFDMSQSLPSSGERIQQVHRKRPDYIALLYRNFPIVYWYADEIDLFKNRGWILKDAEGDFIYSTSLGYYWIDFGNPSCQAWVANWIRHYLDEYGFDGVFADNSLAAAIDHWFWAVEARPINPRTGTYWTDSEIIEAELAYHICVKQAIGSRLLVCNGIWTGERFYKYEDAYAYIISMSPFDGYMSEAIWYKYDGEWLTESQWKKSLDSLVWTQGTGKVFAPVCNIGKADSLLPAACTGQRMYTYAFASTLLGIGTNRNYLGSAGTVDFFEQIAKPLHRIDVGEPTNSCYVIDGTHIYSRDFTKAKVLVNPSDEAYSVILNRDYETLDGQVVSSVRMEPHSGLVLKDLID